MKLADFIIFFLIDSFDDIFLKFIEARSQKIKVFTEQATHVCKHIAYFLRHCLSESTLKLRYHRLDYASDILFVCLILRYEKPYSPMVSHISSHFDTNCLILRHSLASNVPGVSDSVSLYRSSHYSKSLFSNTQQADIEADAAAMLSHISGVL